MWFLFTYGFYDTPLICFWKTQFLACFTCLLPCLDLSLSAASVSVVDKGSKLVSWQPFHRMRSANTLSNISAPQSGTLKYFQCGRSRSASKAKWAGVPGLSQHTFLASEDEMRLWQHLWKIIIRIIMVIIIIVIMIYIALFVQSIQQRFTIFKIK